MRFQRVQSRPLPRLSALVTTARRSPARSGRATPGRDRSLRSATMTRRSEWLSAELEDYVVSHSARPDDLLQQLAAETAASWPDAAGMQIGPEQGTLMTMLARLTGARRALEIGTINGYSS